MNITVLGATGRTGSPLVEELLRRGHTVTALVRDPAKLGPVVDRVRVVVGDSTDPRAVDDALHGADAVVSALGPTSKEPDLHTRTAQALIGAMPAAGVTRFVGVSGAGIDVPGDRKGTRDKIISTLIQRLGGAVVADKPREYSAFAASDLDWTLVRPPRLIDGPATGRITHDAHAPGRATTIRRADLSVFLADVLDQHLYPRQAPFVSAAK
ncbi:MAG: NAD(P)H-binding protein [Actinomycetota bacterium]|nr:NAD(P)H-binding protein [Actinomycetota bacterium]